MTYETTHTTTAKGGWQRRGRHLQQQHQQQRVVIVGGGGDSKNRMTVMMVTTLMILIIAMILAPVTEALDTTDNTVTTTTTTTTTTVGTTTTATDPQVVTQGGSSDTPFLERLMTSASSIQWDNATQVAEFLAREVAIRQANYPSNLVWNHNDDNSNTDTNSHKMGRRDGPPTTSPDKPQIFFLDFDSATAASGEYVYNSETDRPFVLNRLAEDFGTFNIQFTGTRPLQGPYSIITLNDGPAGIKAQNIDVMNLIWMDNATVNINGMGFTGSDIVTATANLAARAVGHLLGLRNGDSFGPPGRGLPSSGKPKPSDYFPNYTGPVTADETTKHTMASAASVGQTNAELSKDKTYLSERSIIKLSFVAGRGRFMTEEEAKKKAPLNVKQMILKNSLQQGINSGKKYLVVWGLMITDGSVYRVGEIDEYQVKLYKDMRLTVEMISNHNTNIMFPFTSKLRLIRTGASDALISENQRGFDGLDSILLDVPITETGTYKIVVEALVLSGNPAGGFYDLLIYAVNPDTISSNDCPANDACIRKRGGILGGVFGGSGTQAKTKVRVAKMVGGKCRTFCTNYAPRWEKLLKFGCDRCDNW